MLSNHLSSVLKLFLFQQPIAVNFPTELLTYRSFYESSRLLFTIQELACFWKPFMFFCIHNYLLLWVQFWKHRLFRSLWAAAECVCVCMPPCCSGLWKLTKPNSHFLAVVTKLWARGCRMTCARGTVTAWAVSPDASQINLPPGDRQQDKCFGKRALFRTPT